MSRPFRPPAWLALVLGAIGLAALYAGPLRSAFLNDDYLFLEQSRTLPLGESLTRLGVLNNFYRPLSRQIYFEALTPLSGGAPLLFHLVNFAAFLAAVLLLLDLLLALAPPAAAMTGALYFATLPLQRVNLTWISCSQDLLALAFSLGALALWRRGRTGLALLPLLAALASKEAALPLALGLIAWDVTIGGRALPEALRRARAPLAMTAGWLVLLAALRAANPGASAFLRFGPAQFAAAYAHEAQSLLGLDHPPGALRGLIARGPDPLALVLLAALAWWIAARPAPEAPRRGALRFGVAWLVLFGFVTGPVAHSWSAYYYTLAAVGAAAAVATLAARIGRAGWVLACAGLLWWHAGATAVRAFAVSDSPWGWTSHLTSFYFERASALGDTLSSQLTRLVPAPARGTRFFFATLPTFAGFQMGNGARIRALYRDGSLESHFYSELSESTAAGHPLAILFWNGAALERLYAEERTPDPLFQIGTDLLVLDRPDGAAYAFRRGLEAGGVREDHLYWLGWAELWRGRREAAETAWREWGAVDDSARWRWKLREAQTVWQAGRDPRAADAGPARGARDTLEARRALIEAIASGIGRPEGHATLGRLLLARSPKYGVLELKVAAWLDPADAGSRIELIRGLAAANLSDAARREYGALLERRPELASDPELREIGARFARAPGAGGVVEF